MDFPERVDMRSKRKKKKIKDDTKICEQYYLLRWGCL